MDNEPKISNVEWGLLIGALLVVDLIQIVLGIMLGWMGGLGLLINRVLDIFVGMSLAFYLQWRGQSMANPKRLFGFLSIFGLEMVAGEFPLWWLDGVYNMMISKSDKIVSKIPGGNLVIKEVEKINKV